MRLFRRMPCIKITRGGVKVSGDDFDVARMLAGGILAMGKMGYDMADMRKALFNLKKRDEEDSMPPYPPSVW